MPSCRVCLSVRLSRSYILWKRLNISSIFLQSGSHIILVFPHRTSWRYSDGVFPFILTGASNAGKVSRNHDSEPISGFIVCCQRCDSQVLSYIHGAAGPWQVIAGSKRRSLLMAGDDDEMFMAKSFNVTPKTTEQHLIVRSYKSIIDCARQTRSIARPLCNCRATWTLLLRRETT